MCVPSTLSSALASLTLFYCHTGVVRVENVSSPEDHIAEVLRRVKPEYLLKSYHITSYEDHEDFLEQVAKRYGKLLKVRRISILSSHYHCCGFEAIPAV